MPKPFKIRITLSVRLALLVICFALLFSTAVIALGHKMMSGLIHRYYQNQIIDNTNALANITHGFIRNHIGNLEQLIDNKIIEKSTISFNDLLLRSHFENFNQYFEIITFANKDGVEEVVYARDGKPANLKNISSTKFFRNAKTHPKEFHLEDSIENRERVPAIRLGKYIVSYFGEEMGFITAQIPFSDLDQAIRILSPKEDIRTVIADRGGQILYDNNGGAFGHYININSVKKQNAVMLSPGIKRSAFLDCKDCIWSETILPDIGWQVFNIVKYEDFVRPLNEFTATIGVWFAILFIVCLGGVMFCLKMTLRLIGLIRKVIHQIAESGDLDRHVEWRSKDDIGDLANSFNLMVNRLKSSQEELIKERSTLENIISSMADAVIVPMYC